MLNNNHGTEFIEKLDELELIHNTRIDNIRYHMLGSWIIFFIFIAFSIILRAEAYFYTGAIVSALYNVLMPISRRWPWSKPVTYPTEF
jgi:hypothetical protein